MRPFPYVLFLFASLLGSPLRAEPRSFLDRLFAAPTAPATSPAQPYRQTATPSGTIPLPETYFSPKGGCTQAIVRELKAARQSILIQAYSFTSAPIAAALVEAARRGVLIEVVLDKSNKTGKYSAADFVAHAGIPTWLDEKHAIAHNKVMILDEATSNVDPASEAAIQKAIDRLFSGRTVIVIAHRLSTIQRCDQIVLLERGAIIEKGTHHQLISAGGAYFRLYQKRLEQPETAEV